MKNASILSLFIIIFNVVYIGIEWYNGRPDSFNPAIFTLSLIVAVKIGRYEYEKEEKEKYGK